MRKSRTRWRTNGLWAASVAASAFLFGGAGELSATPSRRSAEVAVETVEVLEVVEVGGGDEGDVATEEEKR
ncbi:MAG: hypothetical protein IKK39_01465, partial [Thermoguttaceae bacterium]|nr:hypothetical protein [Thermoguttaceae bacterium]